MADSDEDDDKILANFLEAETLSIPDQTRSSRRSLGSKKGVRAGSRAGSSAGSLPRSSTTSSNFSSLRDLIACSIVCRFMNFAASDERFWRWLYCLRRGLDSPTGKPRQCTWNKLYIQVGDAYGNHIEEAVELPVQVDGLCFQDHLGSIRKVNDQGYVNLSGLLKVTTGYGSRGLQNGGDVL